MRAIAITITLATIGALLGSAATAQSEQEKRTAALKDISTFANDICVPQGERTAIDVKGDINAGVTGLLSKLTNLNVGTTGTFKKESYIGVLQDRLVGQALDPVACKMEIVKELKVTLMPAS